MMENVQPDHQPTPLEHDASKACTQSVQSHGEIVTPNDAIHAQDIKASTRTKFSTEQFTVLSDLAAQTVRYQRELNTSTAAGSKSNVEYSISTNSSTKHKLEQLIPVPSDLSTRSVQDLRGIGSEKDATNGQTQKSRTETNIVSSHKSTRLTPAHPEISTHPVHYRKQD